MALTQRSRNESAPEVNTLQHFCPALKLILNSTRRDQKKPFPNREGLPSLQQIPSSKDTEYHLPSARLPQRNVNYIYLGEVTGISKEIQQNYHNFSKTCLYFKFDEGVCS